MLNSPLHNSSYCPVSTQQTNNSDQLSQHGFSNYCLLGIPSETLTGITSYLDPPSLLSLSRVNSTLHHHVAQDNTWRRAFASRYLGIGPESDLCDNINYRVLFRRSERTWKNEFISRFKLERKWENSRSASVSHAPLPSAISNIHLMSCQVVLSSCLKYGIVARSLPLNGKVYSGYLSAAADGIGIGNPNLEFAPNVSTCATASRGGSASLIWGFLDGSVTVVYADKVMNPRRGTAQLRQCSVHEQHQGSVSDSIWADDTDVMRVVTGGTDGQVKLWCNSDLLECVWASDRQYQGLVTDPCTKVAIDKGTIAAAFHSGNISIWTGFPFGQQMQQRQYSQDVKKLFIPCPALQDDDKMALPVAASLHIDTNNEGIALLVIYKDHPFFYRIKVAVGATTDRSIETTAFGHPSFGSITCVSPYFASQPDVGSFVVAGDSLGCISIYDWRSATASRIRKFEAHEDGAAITAIAWNGVTLITGSSRGVINVWDGLTFIHLRSFAAHPSRRHRLHLPVDEGADNETIKQIIIDASREMLVACAGDRVFAWKAGSLPHGSSGKHRARSAASHAVRKNRSSYAKYLEHLEIKETIEESRQMVKQENETFKRVVNREKEHRSELDKLGLTEAEAVEYVMMLSQEDATAAGRGSLLNEPQTPNEDAFEIDEAFEGESRSPSPASTSTASDLTGGSSPLLYVGSPSSFYSRSHDGGRNPVSAPELQASPSASSVSSVSSLVSAASSLGSRPLTVQSNSGIINEAHFPPISAVGGRDTSPSNSALSASKTISASTSSANPRKDAAVTTCGNLSSGKNVVPEPKKSWSNVVGSLSSPHPPLLPSAATGRAPSSATGRRLQPVVTGGGVKHTSSNFHVNNDAEMDEDLRYALELSLAEAQSKGRV